MKQDRNYLEKWNVSLFVNVINQGGVNDYSSFPHKNTHTKGVSFCVGIFMWK